MKKYLLAAAAAIPFASFTSSLNEIRTEALPKKDAQKLELTVAASTALSTRAQKGTRTLRLTGHVFLRGHEYIPRGTNYARVTVSGYTQLQDQDGHWLNGEIRVEDSQGYFLSGNHVSGWARPYAYVNIYDGERKLGTTRIEGSIYVSGWKNGDWIDLDGSGYVDGTLTWTEPDPKP